MPVDLQSSAKPHYQLSTTVSLFKTNNETNETSVSRESCGNIGHNAISYASSHAWQAAGRRVAHSRPPTLMKREPLLPRNGSCREKREGERGERERERERCLKWSHSPNSVLYLWLRRRGGRRGDPPKCGASVALSCQSDVGEDRKENERTRDARKTATGKNRDRR